MRLSVKRQSPTSLRGQRRQSTLFSWVGEKSAKGGETDSFKDELISLGGKEGRGFLSR
jgi:hypothetical protein